MYMSTITIWIHPFVYILRKIYLFITSLQFCFSFLCICLLCHSLNSTICIHICVKSFWLSLHCNCYWQFITVCRRKQILCLFELWSFGIVVIYLFPKLLDFSSVCIWLYANKDWYIYIPFFRFSVASITIFL